MEQNMEADCPPPQPSPLPFLRHIPKPYSHTSLKVSPALRKNIDIMDHQPQRAQHSNKTALA